MKKIKAFVVLTKEGEIHDGEANTYCCGSATTRSMAVYRTVKDAKKALYEDHPLGSPMVSCEIRYTLPSKSKKTAKRKRRTK